jgi:hypothetical protein
MDQSQLNVVAEKRFLGGTNKSGQAEHILIQKYGLFSVCSTKLCTDFCISN